MKRAEEPETTRPDTPELLALRKEWEDNLREKYGERFLDENAAFLNLSWDFVKCII